jgi:hypothetical protein
MMVINIDVCYWITINGQINTFSSVKVKAFGRNSKENYSHLTFLLCHYFVQHWKKSVILPAKVLCRTICKKEVKKKKLPLRLLNRHPLKTRGTKAFLTSVDENFSSFMLRSLYLREIVPGTDWVESLLGRTSDMDAVAPWGGLRMSFYRWAECLVCH